MILVDTSLWVDHLRGASATLTRLLEKNHVLTHPFIIGELALGHLQRRSLIVKTLQNLPQVEHAGDEEVMQFIAQQKLYGLGIGYVDAHLLASCRLSGAELLTRDKKLKAAAQKLHVCYET